MDSGFNLNVPIGPLPDSPVSSGRQNDVRWDGLFADLEAQADSLEHHERAVEISERTRIEVGALSLADRLRPAVGAQIRLRCRGELGIAGVLRQVSAQWVLLDGGRGDETLIAADNVVSVAGVSRLAAASVHGVVESRLGIRQVLRGIATDRSTCQIRLADSSTVVGTIDRVGSDFVEVALHVNDVRRRSEVREVQLLSLPWLVAVRRDMRG